MECMFVICMDVMHGCNACLYNAMKKLIILVYNIELDKYNAIFNLIFLLDIQ